MWNPFKKKSETNPTAMAKTSWPRRHMCPDKHLLAQDCECINCPNTMTCAFEAGCRSTGCESIIPTCSVKTRLTKNHGAVSEFGDTVVAISVRRIFRELTNEEHARIRKEMKERGDFEEKANVKEERDEGTDLYDRPWVLS